MANVVFVDPKIADVSVSTTVVAKLHGLLPDEKTAARHAPAAAPSFVTDMRVQALIHAGRELAGIEFSQAQHPVLHVGAFRIGRPEFEHAGPAACVEVVCDAEKAATVTRLCGRPLVRFPAQPSFPEVAVESAFARALFQVAFNAELAD